MHDDQEAARGLSIKNKISHGGNDSSSDVHEPSGETNFTVVPSSDDDLAQKAADARHRALSAIELLASDHKQTSENAEFIAQQVSECQVISR
jgi:hypothetical protein